MVLGTVIDRHGEVSRRWARARAAGAQVRWRGALATDAGASFNACAQNFSVDIGGPFLAQLPQLSFEGATRRNRPPIKAGDVVYARVVEASRDAEPVLSCTDALGRASGFGHLKDGMTFSVNSLQARALLSSPPPPVLQALGATLRFELAVGLNGRVWVCAAADPEQPSNSHRTATLVAAAVTQSEFLTEQQTQTLVARLISRAKLS